MFSLLKDMIQAIRTGDSRVKAFYGIALATLFISAVGVISSIIATVVCWVAGNKEFVSIIVGAVSLILFIAVFIWMKKCQSER